MPPWRNSAQVMPQCSHVSVPSFCNPLWARTKLVSNSLIGACALGTSSLFWAAHCSHRCLTICLPLRISVRCTVAGLLHLSHFIGRPASEQMIRPMVFRWRGRVNPKTKAAVLSYDVCNRGTMPLTFLSHRLSNGLQIMAEENPDAHSFAAGLFVRAGSRDERPEMAGVSHFLEHMMFKG